MTSSLSAIRTAYSLSGEVVLTLTGPAAAASNVASSSTSRPTTIYLSSLLLTFEGKVELLTPSCPYAAHRLCQVEKELVGPASDGKPIVLTNRAAQSSGVMRWSMTFDLAIPGWLPPSLSLEDHSGSSYAIHAQAKFADDFNTALNAMPTPTPTTPTSPSASRPSTPAPSSMSGLVSSYLMPSLPALSSLINPFSIGRSKVRSAQATPVSIRLNRHRAPKSLNPFRGAPEFAAPLVPPQIYHPTPSLFPVSLESVETRVNVPQDGMDTPEEAAMRIPIELLGNVEVVAGVPEYIGLSEDQIPLSLRIRASEGSELGDGLVMEAFDIEVEQVEKFR